MSSLSPMLPRRIAAVLLDAENIQLGMEELSQLQAVCERPLSVKLAFANWRKLSKDQEQKMTAMGFEMIHVAGDKNGADLKMTALGSLLPACVPALDAVFVVSNDADLLHLCSALTLQGVNVVRVGYTNNALKAENFGSGSDIRLPPAGPRSVDNQRATITPPKETEPRKIPKFDTASLCNMLIKLVGSAKPKDDRSMSGVILSQLGTAFKNHSGVTVKDALREAKITGSFTNFLHNVQGLELSGEGSTTRVKLK